MGTRFYFLSILVSMGVCLSAIVLGSPNASYGESSCKSTVEYMVDNCNKTPIIADTEYSLDYSYRRSYN